MVGGYGLPLLTFLHVSLGSPLAGAGEVGLSFSLSVLWLFWGRGPSGCPATVSLGLVGGAAILENFGAGPALRALLPWLRELTRDG